MDDSRPSSQGHPQQLLKPEDVARILGLTRLQIIRQSRAGKIPCVRVYRYRPGTIETWLREQESASA